MRPELPDPPGPVEFKHHRIRKPNSGDLALAYRDSHRAIAQCIGPLQLMPAMSGNVRGYRNAKMVDAAAPMPAFSADQRSELADE